MTMLSRPTHNRSTPEVDDDDRNIRTSAVAVADNDDLMVEIFSRLPVKSVVRLRCTYKRWYALATHPSFLHAHSRRNFHRPHAPGFFLIPPLLRGFDKNLRFISLAGADAVGIPDESLAFVGDDDDDNEMHFKFTSIMHTCNGLVCCSVRTGTGFDSYYICNPTTREWIPLPQPRRDTLLSCINLAFDPSKSPNWRAVCVRRSEASPFLHQIEIYSPETDTWRRSGEPFSAGNVSFFDGGVFWNGSLNWIGYGDSFCSFEVEEERLRMLPLPAAAVCGGAGGGDVVYDPAVYFGEGGGRLHLIRVHEQGYGAAASLDVFGMGAAAGWSLLRRVDLTVMREVCPEMVVPLALYPNERMDLEDPSPFSIIGLVLGEDEEEVLILSVPGRIVSYHVKKKVFGKLCDLKLKGVDCVLEKHSLFRVVLCASTLSPLRYHL